MSSYATRCTWCGRSTSVSASLQVLSIGIAVVIILVATGLVPWNVVRDNLPGLSKVAPPQRAPVQETPPPSSGGGGPLPPGGYGRVEGGRNDAEAERRAGGGDQATTVVQQAVRPRGCDSPERITTLRLVYPDWKEEDLPLIACREVRIGFTGDQVRASIGRPQRISQPASSHAQIWIYRDRRLVLEAGEVVAIR